jgi:hypothetical protein
LLLLLLQKDLLKDNLLGNQLVNNLRLVSLRLNLLSLLNKHLTRKKTGDRFSLICHKKNAVMIPKGKFGSIFSL